VEQSIMQSAKATGPNRRSVLGALYNATTGISASRDVDSLTEAIRTSLEQLNPDLYSAVLVTDGQPVSLFNLNLDGAHAGGGGGSDVYR